MSRWVGRVHNGIRRIKNKLYTGLWYRHLFYRIGPRSSISPPFYTENPDFVQLGEKVYIGPNCRIEAYPSQPNASSKQPMLIIGNRVTMEGGVLISCGESLVIEDDVLIAGRCYISDNNHSFDPLGLPYREQEADMKPTRIGAGVWLGQNVCILAGSDIGERSVIGAGSVVRGRIPPYSVAVGSPARVVKRYSFETKTWVKADEAETAMLRRVQG